VFFELKEKSEKKFNQIYAKFSLLYLKSSKEEEEENEES
jgi:hypothetical protein